MNSLRMLEEDEDNAPDVAQEDQDRISRFAVLNMRFKYNVPKLEALKQEKEALDDLATELELADEDEPALYKLGETFLHMPLPKALKRVEKEQSEVSEQVSSLSKTVDEWEKEMTEIKVALYAKFGTSINLDD
ncbi:Prefoldin subunit 4 [Mycena venus]|uniref:Prefoldin subunit 4 n=1 Tax=Mycena venus TaxID=2733690 RepID=A0A8H6YFC7_9AGAR|nr:Prefoldin subunit 4 [Mycena venus]